MKIAILGSWRDRNKEKFGLIGTFNEYKEFCGKLGASLAKYNHEIVVGNYYEDSEKQEITAEKTLIDAYLRSLSNANKSTVKKITVIHPYGDFRRFEEIKKKSPAIFDLYENIKLMDWGSIHLEIAKRSDLLIIIGGGRLTNNAGYTCYNIKDFLIPIPNFGGAGKIQLELFKINAPEKYDTLKRILNYLNNQDFDGFIGELTNIPENLLSGSVSISSIEKQINELHKMVSFGFILNEKFTDLVEKLKNIATKITKIEIKVTEDLKVSEINLLEEAYNIFEMIEITRQAQVYKNALDAGRHEIYIRIDQWMKDHPKIKNFLKGFKKVTDFASEISRPFGILSKILNP